MLVSQPLLNRQQGGISPLHKSRQKQNGDNTSTMVALGSCNSSLNNGRISDSLNELVQNSSRIESTKMKTTQNTADANTGNNSKKMNSQKKASRKVGDPNTGNNSQKKNSQKKATKKVADANTGNNSKKKKTPQKDGDDPTELFNNHGQPSPYKPENPLTLRDQTIFVDARFKDGNVAELQSRFIHNKHLHKIASLYLFSLYGIINTAGNTHGKTHRYYCCERCKKCRIYFKQDGEGY